MTNTGKEGIMYIPYMAIIEGDFKTLLVDKRCSNKFLVDGELVKIPKSGVVVFPKNTEIAVGKILHHIFHKVQMAKSKQLLYHNSTILQHDMGATLTLAEKEILLCSIEIVEII